MSITKDYYKTSDLGLATALVAVGYKLVDLDKSNPRRAEFKFIDDEQLRMAADDYWNSALNVSALAYFDWLKRLKTRLYS